MTSPAPQINVPQSEVWADVIGAHVSRKLATVLFSTTANCVQDPIFLSRWKWQAQGLMEQRLQASSAYDQRMVHWMNGEVVANQVVQLVGQRELGVDLFGADIPLPDWMPPGWQWHDHNAGLLRLDCRGGAPVVVGPVGAANVAMKRLSVLFEQGAKPAIAARVQANSILYEHDPRDAPAMVVFASDPRFGPDRLAALANQIFDLKSQSDLPPVLATASAGPRASDESWHYHRRFPIPRELTQGVQVYAADIWVHRPFLLNSRFVSEKSRFVPIIAEPGEQGGIELVPFDRVAQVFPPELAQWFHSLA